MRNTAGLIAALAIVGCDGGPGLGGDAGSEASNIFGDVQYTLRCEASGDCAGPVDVDVCGFHAGETCREGDPPANVACSAIGDMLRIVASQGDGPELTVTVPLPGSAPALCDVAVEVDGETYARMCGSDCYVSDLEQYDDVGNPTIEGRVFCARLSNGSAERELTAAGIGPAASMPGRFRVANCPGIE